jgi:hypothetical protein
MDWQIDEKFPTDFPEFDATPVASVPYNDWRIDVYDLSINGSPAGVGAVARNALLTYKLLLSGLMVDHDSVVRLLTPHLDAALRVRGLVPVIDL